MIGFTMKEILASVIYALSYGCLFALSEVTVGGVARLVSVIKAFLRNRLHKSKKTIEKKVSVKKTTGIVLPVKIFLFGIGFILLSYFALDGEVRLYMLAISSAAAFLPKSVLSRVLSHKKERQNQSKNHV